MSLWESRFVPTSFFPSVSLDSIREIEFQLEVNFRSISNFNDLEYFELVIKYEKLVDYRKKENESENNDAGEMSIKNFNPKLHQSVNRE